VSLTKIEALQRQAHANPGDFDAWAALERAYLRHGLDGSECFEPMFKILQDRERQAEERVRSREGYSAFCRLEEEVGRYRKAATVAEGALVRCREFVVIGNEVLANYNFLGQVTHRGPNGHVVVRPHDDARSRIEVPLEAMTVTNAWDRLHGLDEWTRNVKATLTSKSTWGLYRHVAEHFGKGET